MLFDIAVMPLLLRPPFLLIFFFFFVFYILKEIYTEEKMKKICLARRQNKTIQTYFFQTIFGGYTQLRPTVRLFFAPSHSFSIIFVPSTDCFNSYFLFIITVPYQHFLSTTTQSLLFFFFFFC